MTTATATATVPTQDWSVEQLGEFARETGKRTAHDIWLTGKAIRLARKKLKHGTWLPWCAKYVPFLSVSTVRRYISVAELDEDSVKGQDVKAVYIHLGLMKEGSKRQAPDLTSEKDIRSQEGDIEAQEAEEAAERRRTKRLARKIIKGNPRILGQLEVLTATIADGLNVHLPETANAETLMEFLISWVKSEAQQAQKTQEKAKEAA